MNAKIPITKLNTHVMEVMYVIESPIHHQVKVVIWAGRSVVDVAAADVAVAICTCSIAL